MPSQHKTKPAVCKNCKQIFMAEVYDLDHREREFCGGTCRNLYRAMTNRTRCGVEGQNAPSEFQNAPTKRNQPTRKDIARSFLDKHGYVTNRMFDSVHLLHTGRNAVAEVKGEYAEKGYAIKFIPSEKFMDNKWVLEPIQATAGVQ